MLSACSSSLSGREAVSGRSFNRQIRKKVGLLDKILGQSNHIPKSNDTNIKDLWYLYMVEQKTFLIAGHDVSMTDQDL